MNSIPPSIEFFAGIPEELSDVRLRRDRHTSENSVKMTFIGIASCDLWNAILKPMVGNLPVLLLLN
jgi:photosystem II Psb28-2 protein